MKPRHQAALLLTEAALLLEGDEVAPMIRHLARVLRSNQLTEEATRHVVLPTVQAQPILVRQDAASGRVTLIHRETGERKEVSAATLVEKGVSGAWSS